ncbi:MAG: hypothetical protein F6K10_30640 [Moorea sp. SIO2B7]|nr:hypothetical protein [Moorena sp. SIO2B7]
MEALKICSTLTQPIPIHRDRFLQRLDKASFYENVEVSVRDDYFETNKEIG